MQTFSRRKLALVGTAMVLVAGTAGVGATWASVSSVVGNELEATVPDPADLDTGLALKVGATDEQGNAIPGEWQEARDETGVSFAVPGAGSLFPGSVPVSVTVPVLNDSARSSASLALSLRQLPDLPAEGRVTDERYLGALRFSVEQPPTSLSPAAVPGGQDLTSDELRDLQVNSLAAHEESELTVTIRLASASEDPSATWADDDLSGARAFVQLVIDGTAL